MLLSEGYYNELNFAIRAIYSDLLRAYAMGISCIKVTSKTISQLISTLQLESIIAEHGSRKYSLAVKSLDCLDLREQLF